MNPIYDSVCRDLGYRPVDTRITISRIDNSTYLYRYTQYVAIREPNNFAIINPA